MVVVRQEVVWTVLVVIVIWLYKSFIPPPPKICGTLGGPPITGPRILLRDGRHLSYEEYGVPKSNAKFNIIFIHGHTTTKKDSFLIAPELFEEFQVYIVGFDRPGYGESDPDPKRTVKSLCLDIEELGDKLKFGQKFYIIGYSGGGNLGWGCIKYIPQRLAGIILIAPLINYWWPHLPSTLVKQAFDHEEPWNQCNLRIAHYTPWLLYWWNTQQIYPQSLSNYNDAHYKDILLKSDTKESSQEYSTQQGLYESYLRDAMVNWGEWEFDPLDLQNPFSESEGYVKLWQGDKDEMVSVSMQRYIVQNLPWIHYQEVPNVGHHFALEDDVKYQIIKSLYESKSLISTNGSYAS